MAAREEVLKKIAKKKQEIKDLELKVREGIAFIQGMEEVLKLLPKDAPPLNAEQILRPGTTIYAAREAIKAAGRPLHITDVLKALGMEASKKNRLSLSGSLSGYARRAEVFTRPAPNTFGLVEFGLPIPPTSAFEPPDDFGEDPVEEEPDYATQIVNFEPIPVPDDEIEF